MKNTKRVLREVTVTLTQEDGKADDTRIHVIPIPIGGAFKLSHNFTVDRVLNRDGEIVADYAWQAGYTRKYTYLYE